MYVSMKKNMLSMLCLITTIAWGNQNNVDNYLNRFTNVYFDSHKYIIGDFIDSRKDWSTSNLGSILFKSHKLPKRSGNKTFVILIWEFWDWLKERHVHNFKSKRSDPLEKCSVHNCWFVGTDDYLDAADAVVVHLHHGFLPKIRKRNQRQRWIFLSDESPLNTFQLSKKPPKLSELANVFNWSMTYRSDSDVPVPYGRTLPRLNPVLNHLKYNDIIKLVPNWKKKQRDVLATVLMSNCGVTHRMRFLSELNKYLRIDIFGKCSYSWKNICPGYFKEDCKIISEYIFYLVLENSMCKQYISEKSFYHAYSKGAIPVIKGPPLEDCKKLLPPNSYLHFDNYATVKDLAKAMIEIGSNEETLLSYHYWRNNFEVLNEHGYFGSRSYHLCRLCEAMNYNDGEKKVYSEDELRIFLDQNILCQKAS